VQPAVLLHVKVDVTVVSVSVGAGGGEQLSREADDGDENGELLHIGMLPRQRRRRGCGTYARLASTLNPFIPL